MVTAARARRSCGVVLAASALVACSGGKTQSPHDGVDASASDGGGPTDAPSGSDAAADAGAGADDGVDAYACTRASDCPTGQACDANTSRCSLTCGAMQPCNGGCCAGAPDGSANGTCQGGALETGCGYNGRECTSCPAAFSAGTGGYVCQRVGGGGTCGCSMKSDCPPVSAGCDKITEVCVFACSFPAEPCLAGCCGAGKCETGTSRTACGTSGGCADCTGNLNGSACVAGACGCQVATDCPASYACDPATSRCTMQ